MVTSSSTAMPKPVKTALQLTRDAVTRNNRPGHVVRRIDGAEVQLTSWPWWDGEGPDRSARVMARLTVGDCRTNREIPYFSIMTHVREETLD